MDSEAVCDLGKGHSRADNWARVLGRAAARCIKG